MVDLREAACGVDGVEDLRGGPGGPELRERAIRLPAKDGRGAKVTPEFAPSEFVWPMNVVTSVPREIRLFA